MRTAFIASWYDPDKMEKNAIAAGWDPNSGDGFLDIYHPEEDADAEDDREFRTREEAVAFAKQIAAEGKDFWGQTTVREYEIGGRRCRYCTCHGMKLTRKIVVDQDGVLEDLAESDCLDDDGE